MNNTVELLRRIAAKCDYKLDRDKKLKWINALRSGKYHQGDGLLCCSYGQQERHCCLGVYLEQNENLEKRISDNGDIYYTDKEEVDDICETYIPYEIMPADVQNVFIEFNDEDMINFNEIADIIERAL